jgi:hypothetical protein
MKKYYIQTVFLVHIMIKISGFLNRHGLVQKITNVYNFCVIREIFNTYVCNINEHKFIL